ncbi:hypothetical protein ACJ41O_003299 [Fusarium nematophilum]
MTLITKDTGGRAAKLIKSFWAVAKGEQKIANSHSARLYLQACKAFCEQKTVVKGVEVLIASTAGVSALETSVRADLSPQFIMSATLPFILALADPGVASLNHGRFLRQLLASILEPPTFWAALLAAYYNGQLDDAASSLEAFAWLCLQVVSDQSGSFASPQADVRNLMADKSLLSTQNPEARKIAYRIEKVIAVFSQPGALSQHASPGGRHDNDSADFRKISIYPTSDELLSNDEPYLQRLADVFSTPMDTRAQVYRDWLFRLLRDDMLSELREDMQTAMGQRKSRRRPAALGQLKVVGVNDVHEPHVCASPPLALNLACYQGIDFPRKLPQEGRKKHLVESKNFLKHDSFGALCCDGTIVAFGSLVREIHNLVKTPPIIGIKFTSRVSLEKALEAFQGPGRDRLKFFIVDTATFAYEPILRRLKCITELPLETQLIDPEEPSRRIFGSAKLESLVKKLTEASHSGLSIKVPATMHLKKDISLEGAQLDSFINGLSRELALIQGPPGTGKSFIGALILLAIFRLTDFRILVLSYTNHALDQFMEDLMDIGVSADQMVRLGSKCTEATRQTQLRNYDRQKRFWLTTEERSILDKLKRDATGQNEELHNTGKKLSGHGGAADILEFLEFSERYTYAWFAFQVPDDDDFQIVVAKNKALQPEDLYAHWLQNAPIEKFGSLASALDPDGRELWALPLEARKRLHDEWSRLVREEQISNFVDTSDSYSQGQSEIRSILDERGRRVLKEKRVIASTTTGAAMYQALIETAHPDVVLVEEAGEILEAHVITALSPSVKQLILIGDHKQLRPKVSSYKLTKEKGEGYDLNVSLFERLVVSQERHYTTLEEQHRSHPDISYYPRMLAYPNLKDALKTSKRSPIRGLRNRVAFVHHERPEDDMAELSERRDPITKTSKKNLHEAQMVLKMVKYLGQQGYKTEDMVVLTPYLGQLSLLRETLRKDTDPYLTDIDSHDLVRAGLLSHAAAKVNKKPLRLSTIDNYQGEECDIVIVSLTRSNSSGDIGFLHARERLVVLLSRARSGLIVFGNMQTFMKSKKGGEMWAKYFDALKRNESLFDGVPVSCERHPETSMLLKTAEDFDNMCPDGGCALPCGAQLSCGKHNCNRRCHRVQDHSQVSCVERVGRICKRGHESKVRCGDKSGSCAACTREDADNRRRVLRDQELEKKRQQQQEKYRRDLQEMDDEIDHLRRVMKYQSEEKQHAETLKQRKQQLKSLRETEARVKTAQQKASDQASTATAKSAPTPIVDTFSSVAKEWEHMKKAEGAQNAALDKLMGMIGLEAVKDRLLAMKSMVDTKLRQGFSLAGERFSCSLLGNPGTGKTTVARIYADFLTSVGAIAGSAFEEVTGSKLANMGVSGCEKLLEKIMNDGGGVMFMDEAYQLSSGNSPGGKAVLDYLLAEVENLRGKVVFILAGYSREMESFFAHNPGIPSRFPVEMKFDDYTDDELLRILQVQVHRKFGGRMAMEEGVDGRLLRIVSRRIGHGRGKDGFGNARAAENYLQLITDRQARRIQKERRAGRKPDDLLLAREDIIGPEPSEALTKCKAYQDLACMIGLAEVKDSLKVLMDTLKTNYDRELAEEPLVEFSLNRVFLGSPGTGKTTVAKLYGRILADLGLLSNGEVVVKNPADFVGAALGQSEAQTKGILAATVGKVLVIDEAYGLYGGGANGAVSDPYKTAVIDTIVAEVQSVPGEDRCVLLLGYKDEMEKMFQNVNPGLSRRFPLSSAFVFEDFDDEDLAKILDLKLGKSGFTATDKAKAVALDVLRRARNRPNFGNAGEIEIILGKAKESHQRQVSAGKAKRHGRLEAVDFDEDYDRAERGDTDVKKLFEGDVGRDKVISVLQDYQTRVRHAKRLDIDPEIPFNFLFRGPPGTGKTTTAKKMGKVFYDMGFLDGTKVIECSATDLIGQYVGQTGPKVQQLLDKALGRILFIDEAYRLASGSGSFAKEAVDELVDSVTKPKYQGKLIIILAGYVEDINSLLAINPGMSSRFPVSIDFEPLAPQDCIQLMTHRLQARKNELEGKLPMDLSCLERPRKAFSRELVGKFQTLSEQQSWANARDVKELAEAILHRFDLSLKTLVLTESLVRVTLDEMIAERGGRMNNTKKPVDDFSKVLADIPNLVAPTTRVSTSTVQKEEEQPDEAEDDPDDHSMACAHSIRDVGVSDEVWEQLQRDKEKEAQDDEEFRRLKKAQETARDGDRERIVREVLAEEERRREIEAKKAKLQSMGICPAGFAWTKQGGGYRCAGGAHWIPNEAIEKM